MKNLKIKFGLFSLLAVLAVSVFLTSCEQEDIASNVIEEVSTVDTPENLYIVVPDGLTGEAAVEWAKSQPTEQFEEVGENTLDIIESRWCTLYEHYKTRHLSCWCYYAPYQGTSTNPWGYYCVNVCDYYKRWCGGWSGGQYVVYQDFDVRCSWC